MVKDLCFEVIEKCLNNCKFCSSNSDCNKSRIISFDDFKRVIDYFMKNGGIEELSISGGEPFLHSDLVNMVSYAKSLGIRTVIFTSGVVYNEGLSDEEIEYYKNEMNERLNEVYEHESDNLFLINCIKRYYNNLLTPRKYSPITKDLLYKLKNIGLDKIVFDYQGYEEETDCFLMGRTNSARESLLDSLLNAACVCMNVDVHFVPMKVNYKEIPDILEMLEIANIDNISILNFLPQGRGYQNKEILELSSDEKKEFFKILDDCRNNYSGNIRIGIPLQGDTTHKCNAGLEKLDIKFDGSVLPCPAFKEITPDECKKFNIKVPNIYDNLESINIPGTGTRARPLCKEYYDYKRKK